MLKRDYGHAFRSQLRHMPVWDVGAPVAAGDFGTIQDNCFTKLGNIVEEFQATPVMAATNAPSLWEFTSAGTRTTEGRVTGKAGEADVAASLELHFEAANSLFVKAPDSVLQTIENVAEVCRQLKNHPNWDRSHAFVTSARLTPALVLIMNTTAKSSVVLHGDAGELARLLSASLSVGAKIAVTGDAGLRQIGVSGAVYVDLMRLNIFGTPKVAVMGEDDVEFVAVEASPPEEKLATSVGAPTDLSRSASSRPIAATRLSITQEDDNDIMLAGWIFAAADLRHPAIEHSVVLKPTLRSDVTLPPGVYFYRFNATGTGTFTVTATCQGTDTARSFDTKDGALHLSFRFEVIA